MKVCSLYGAGYYYIPGTDIWNGRGWSMAKTGWMNITLAGKTHVSEAVDGKVWSFEIAPGSLSGLKCDRWTTCVVEIQTRMPRLSMPCWMVRGNW